MANHLPGIFMRFWKEDIAKDNDLNGEIEEYEMCVHPFGALLSGACANYALIKTADDGEDEFGSDNANTLRRDFYMDDWLSLWPTYLPQCRWSVDRRSSVTQGVSI